MKCSMVVVLLAVIITAVVPPQIVLGGNPSGIYGTVLINGQGAGGLTVHVSEANNRGNTYAVKTDAGGYYDIYGTPGQWEMSIEAPSVWTAELPSVVLVNLVEESRVRVDFAFIGPALTPTPFPTALATATPTATPAPALGSKDMSPLDEVRALWPKFELELPIKEMMFLGGLIIRPLEPLVGCLRPFGYLFALIYCLAVVQWQINHPNISWGEFLDSFMLGTPGKMMVLVSIMASPIVYLTLLNDIAVVFWWAENSFIREALGWKLLGFSPDLDPESMLELLKWIPEWVVLHNIWEVMLFLGFIFSVIWAGLMRNLGILRTWCFCYAMYVMYGPAVYAATLYVDWVRGAGIVGNNILWSSFVRINKMFVGSTKALFYLLSLVAPTVYVIYDMFFASRKPATGTKRTISSEDALNVAQTGALLWNMWQNRQPTPAPAGGVWPMWGPQYGRLGQGALRLPSGDDSAIPPPGAVPPTGKNPGPQSPTAGGSGGGGARNAQQARSNPVIPLAAPSRSEDKSDQAPRTPAADKWTILPANVKALNQQGAPSAQSSSQPGKQVAAKEGEASLGEVSRKPPVAGADSVIPAVQSIGDADSQRIPTGSVSEDRPSTVIVGNDHHTVAGDDGKLPEPPVTATVVPATPAEDVVLRDPPTVSQPVFRAARMKAKFGDLDESEPVLVKIGEDGTAETVDGTKIPLDQLALEPDEEGGAG